MTNRNRAIVSALLAAVVVFASAAPPAAAQDGQQFSLTVVNESSQPWTFFVYQRHPSVEQAGGSTLAWLASRYLVRPGDPQTGSRSQWAASWTIDYGFVWSETGKLRPGVSFVASGYQPADPGGNNSSTFDLEGGPGLSRPEKQALNGELIIRDSKIVPPDRFSVGVSMSQVGVFAVQAGPSLMHRFEVATGGYGPTYWVAAGHGVEVGDVLRADTLTPTAEVRFPTSVFNMKATIGTDNEWTIEPLE